ATGLPPAVGVTRLAEGNPDGKGTIPADSARLPRDLWGPAPAGEIAQAIAGAQPRLSAGRWLLQRMLTAQLDPPAGTAHGDGARLAASGWLLQWRLTAQLSPRSRTAQGGEGRLCLARVDRLTGRGRPDDAESLLHAEAWKERARYERLFDNAV